MGAFPGFWKPRKNLAYAQQWFDRLTMSGDRCVFSSS